MKRTEYARGAGGSLVANREVGGSGAPIVYVAGGTMPIEVMHEDPLHDRFLQGLAAFGRLFVFDRRGIGASDPPDWDQPLIPQWVDDLMSVLDSRGLEGVTVVGHEAGASVGLGAEIGAFVGGDYRAPPPERPMLALLFTDLVGSTERAAASGDAAWRGMLARHDELVRAAIARHGGTVVKTTGDGIIATFPTASRAVSGAIDLRAALDDVGLAVRMGVHVGEVAVRDDDVVGIAVHVAARVMSAAGPGDIFVSSTVAAVATGGPHRFTSVDHEPLRGLEGVEGEWEVLAVE